MSINNKSERENKESTDKLQALANKAKKNKEIKTSPDNPGIVELEKPQKFEGNALPKNADDSGE